jgi:hypothetical protein
MKLLVVLGVIVAGMSGCGAARVADQSARFLNPTPAAADHQAVRPAG